VQSRTNPAGISRKPSQPRGKIKSLVQTASDGWERGEITVKQPAPSDYPQIRDQFVLLESDGNQCVLPLIKGAHRDGYVCPGRPGDFKSWIMKHYPKTTVIPDEVFFELTANRTTYRIYTSQQWKERG